MVAALKRGYQMLAQRPLVRVVLQTMVSVLLIAILFRAAQSTNVVASLQSLPPIAFVAAAAILGIGYLLNSVRWQFLLRNVGIRERVGNLAALYFIGQFFSLFLPTSTGGDAVRVYHVARESGRPSEALVATLQERLFGLASSLVIGLAATLYYLPLVPPQLRVWAIIVQAVGAVGVAVLLYPAKIIAVAGRICRIFDKRGTIERLATHPRAAFINKALRSVADLPSLTARQFFLLLGMAMTSTLLGVGTYYVLGLSLGLHLSFVALCLIVPSVWIIRMAPVSLSGIGVGEGAFVFLTNIFAVASSAALALALAVLAVQTSFALFGGVLLAFRMVRGTWSSTRRVGSIEKPTSA